MKLCKCPICHSEISLEALIEDDAGRELLNTIVNIGGNCGRAVVAYLGLFKPQKNSLANSRALKIVQSLLELYTPSNVLEKALMDTVEQVRRNRRETGRCEPLANHNYLKKVYESVKPQFAVVRSEAKAVSSLEAQQRQADQKKHDAVMYVERMKQMGQLEAVKNTESYQIWLKWQEEKQNATAN
ncbi:hypothetical protein ABCW44_06885 [Mannheimia haemolytica]|uniref:hypothetical protein n=1 Tax=Mannheimia haemolytica TaxID=75985 RepID=UPI00320A39F5